jgi:UDP-N-acetylmuramoyl-tripeptide--D-alanyl-D-alanine ligase
MLRKILEYKLRFLARLVLKKYQPKVVAVTGSVGKTSTREAIACVLGTRFRVRQNRKNYNNEIGLPLTILNVDSPGKSLLGWFVVVLKSWQLILFKDKNFPEILVLEMGIDHPGDMEYLTSIARPDLAVITNIGQAHLEYFETEDNIAREKGVLVKNLQPKGLAILNYDDVRVRKMAKLTKARFLTYGLTEVADVKALEVISSFEKNKTRESLAGLAYKLKYHGSFVPVHLPSVIGTQSVYASLAAATVGVEFGLNLVEISQALETYKSPKGRMRLVAGLNDTIIIDDTYNASPQSTLVAIEVVGQIKLAEGARRWAVLGDMLELGSFTSNGHQAVGRAVAKNNFDFLVAVGERSLLTMAAAKDSGFAVDNIFHFMTSIEALDFLKDRLKTGDVTLVKGSQGVRMERVVRAIMAEPTEAPSLLVRQDWPDA